MLVDNAMREEVGSLLSQFSDVLLSNETSYPHDISWDLVKNHIATI
jgi:hypothetical protein